MTVRGVLVLSAGAPAVLYTLPATSPAPLMHVLTRPNPDRFRQHHQLGSLRVDLGGVAAAV